MYTQLGVGGRPRGSRIEAEPETRSVLLHDPVHFAVEREFVGRELWGQWHGTLFHETLGPEWD
ncbi:MAG: hypothetical protein H6831_08850 [Planctomycetes bacterium]|nr:hypothetical protein [Planctomycetota bacterium]MCB9904499.1 hypothetical protein [Planctomycetota bacterium]